MLFAESTDAGTAGLVLLAGLIGGAATWLWNALTTSRKQRRADRQEDDTTMIGRYEALMKRIDADRKECEEREQKLQARVEHGIILSERAVTWIKHLEVILDANKLPFRRWQDLSPDGSGPHQSLPGGQP